jgi:uncharacterized membrane protein
MITLIAGLIIFLGVHSVSIINEPWRDRMVEKIGLWPWKGLYSALSLVGFILIVNGYEIASITTPILYYPPLWLQHLSLLLLVPVFILLIAAYMPGRIKQAVTHPMLTAVKLWALAHLLANGSLADVALFGSFLLWAVLDRISFRRRVARPIPGAPVSPKNDAIAIGAGLLLYLAFLLWLHKLLFGVSPY